MANATGIEYLRANNELMRNGLIVRATFPSGETSVTVPVDNLNAHDIVIINTEAAITAGSELQEDFGARSTGTPGTVTIIRADQWTAQADVKFSMLLIRNGMGMPVGITQGNPALVYSHPGGMYAFKLTTVAGSSQSVSLPGINLRPFDMVKLVKLGKASSEIYTEDTSARNTTSDTISIVTERGNDITAGDTLLILVFKRDEYVTHTLEPQQGVCRIGRPFGDMDVAGRGDFIDAIPSQVPYITSDSVVILAHRNAHAAETPTGIAEIYASRSAGIQGRDTAPTFLVASSDSDMTPDQLAYHVYDYIVIQAQRSL